MKLLALLLLAAPGFAFQGGYHLPKKIPLGAAAGGGYFDDIAFDPAARHVYLSPGALPLGGAPEQAVADGKGIIYDNLENKNGTIAFDARMLKITARWPVAPAGQPVSIAMDRRY